MKRTQDRDDTPHTAEATVRFLVTDAGELKPGEWSIETDAGVKLPQAVIGAALHIGAHMMDTACTDHFPVDDSIIHADRED
jgi:hypothetical protein